MSKTLIVLLLIAIIIGLWFFPAQTKSTITGAFAYVKGLAVISGAIK